MVAISFTDWLFLLMTACIVSCKKKPAYTYVGDHAFTLADENFCPGTHDSIIDDTEVEWDFEDRANVTRPTGLVLANSTIQGAGLGIFTTYTIPAGVWFGPYEGEVIYDEYQLHYNADYAFQLKKNDYIYMYRDAWNPNTSNWLRYVNCATDMMEQNLEFLQCKDEIYFRSIKTILAGQELMLFYGFGYLYKLKIDMNSYCKWYNGTFYQAIDSDFICTDEDFRVAYE
ncbi:unnamed protein product [Owenia fusiformis]|uniref:Uncharacterized protein n=1 Tax=Owenia fusiformis TaxID=6347 RepID=A0A8J1XMK9_OWEFU|nr:unnamed protein product [Owenia fusiformis]